MSKMAELRLAFEAVGNGERAVKMSAYMRDLFPFLGIEADVRKQVSKPFIAADKKLKKIDWDFLRECYEQPEREFQYFVVDYLTTLKKFLSFEDIVLVRKFIESKSWWDTVDGLDRVVGDLGLVDDRVDALMLEWSRDENFWVRRVAIDHQLGRKDRVNLPLLREILLNNFGSDEFFINKAIGWSLREVSKFYPEWVSEFLSEFKGQMASLSVREASKYL